MAACEKLDDATIAELLRGARAIGLKLSGEQVAQFEGYLITLLQWQRRMSLTSTTGPLDLVRNHVLDSLHVVPFIQQSSRIADLGSGAGFPGVSLAIARSDAQVDLVESRRKKANFLREVLRCAGIANASVVEERMERLGQTHEGVYDMIVSRAVWRVRDLLQTCGGLLRTSGVAIAMKGPRGREEAIEVPGFAQPETTSYAPPSGAQRVLLLYRKR